LSAGFTLSVTGTCDGKVWAAGARQVAKETIQGRLGAAYALHLVDLTGQAAPPQALTGAVDAVSVAVADAIGCGRALSRTVHAGPSIEALAAIRTVEIVHAAANCRIADAVT
jgi:hypothetical protein